MTGWRRRSFLLLLAATPSAAQAADVPEPAGYRTENYRSPTPNTLAGARVLTTAAARALWQEHAVTFIDVLPLPPRPAGLPAGTIWRQRTRRDIPGSLWLPDVGYGALAPVMQDYFARNLAAIRDRKLVFYCLAGCWHSWNAAKRALALGCTQVAWYPQGTDGWQAAGLPLEAREPVPRPDLSE